MTGLTPWPSGFGVVPILNELADSLPENTTIAKLNVDESQQIAAKYGVRSIPTSIVFKNGKEIKRFVGVKPASFFLKELEKLG
jgi:thioredoxin 1